MLDYIYNVLWQQYTPQTAEICYSDTDSVMIKLHGLEGKTNEDKYKHFLSKFPEYERDLHFAKKGDITIGKMKLETF